MTMEYVRTTYGVPAYRGARVRVKAWDGWCEGTITSATHYVHVRPDRWPNARLRCHPTDTDVIQYLEPHQGRGGGECVTP